MSKRRQPHFIGIGVPKAGTSWLARCLDEHPMLSVPIKETKFFSDWFEEGETRYELKLGETVQASFEGVGEFCTKYFNDPRVPKRIYELYPSIKIILVLRNPVDRIESMVRHRKMRGRSWGIHDAITKSFYSERTESWKNFFPGMKVLFYEHFKESPYVMMQEVYSYLEVDEYTPPSLFKKVNRTVTPRSKTLVRIFDYLGKFRYKRWFRTWWWKSWAIGLRDSLKRLNRKGDQYLFDKDDRSKIISLYEKDYDKLKEILGEELPWQWYT